MKRIAIFGLGLIGGSVGLGARRLGVQVVGIDFGRTLAAERARDCADELVAAEDRVACRAALANAELTLLAAPVSVILAELDGVLAHSGTVTDCGSTKREIAWAADRSPRRQRFVPGHPMAGAPEGGITNARADLFEGRPWILCPEGRDRDAVGRVEELVRALGARPMAVSAERHDRLVALVSHVPQLVASAFGALGAEWGAEGLAGPAYEGITRTAGGDPAMWQDVFSTNGDQVAKALGEFAEELGRVARALERTPTDIGPALALIERARRGRRPG